MDKIKKTYSGEGQDIFVSRFLQAVKNEDFLFLDIGCGNTLEKSNSYAFEEIGCHGYCVDVAIPTNRKSQVIQCNVADERFDELISNIKSNVSYISIDVDKDSGIALEKVLFSKNNIKFDIMTFEHELCCGNVPLKNRSFEILQDKGYFCLFENVRYNESNDSAFEDWWINPNLKTNNQHSLIIKNKKSNPNLYKNMYWGDILKLI